MYSNYLQHKILIFIFILIIHCIYEKNEKIYENGSFKNKINYLINVITYSSAIYIPIYLVCIFSEVLDTFSFYIQ